MSASRQPQTLATGDGWVPEPEHPENTFGYRLRMMRRQLEQRDGRKISANELAEWCGYNGGTWGAWERGINKPPHLHAICRQIHEATGVSVDYLLGVAHESICTHAAWDDPFYEESRWRPYDEPLPLGLAA